MASKVKCGVYVIEQIGCQKYYIGSSKSIRSRWHQHRMSLKQGKHHSPYLQNAWTKYGEEAFEFWVVEECNRDELLIREQEYIDTLNPVFNVCPKAGSREGSKYTPEQLEKARIIHSARAALVTHCPHGHEYTEDNMMERKGKKVRICLACNALRVSAIYAAETPEQREARRQRAAVYAATNEGQKAKLREYAAAHKAEKHAYDVSRHERANELKRQRRAEMTPEQRAQLSEQKRQSYLRHQETARAYNVRHKQQKNEDRNRRLAQMTPEQRARHLELKRQSYARQRMKKEPMSP